MKYLKFLVLSICVFSMEVSAHDGVAQELATEVTRMVLQSSADAVIDQQEELGALTALKRRRLETSPFALHMMWINQLPTSHPHIVPPAEMENMVTALGKWRELNPNMPIDVWYYNANGEQCVESTLCFPPDVRLRNLDDVINGMPTVLRDLHPQYADLAKRVAENLPKLFSMQSIQAHLKADLARLLVAMHQLHTNPRQAFMYADISIMPHSIVELLRAYGDLLERFGIVMGVPNNDLTDDEKERFSGEILAQGMDLQQVEVSKDFEDGFENGVFIARNHRPVLDMFSCIVASLISNQTLSWLKENGEQAKEMVYFMMEPAFVYLMCVTPNTGLTLKKPKTLAGFLNGTLNLLDVCGCIEEKFAKHHCRWPEEVLLRGDRCSGLRAQKMMLVRTQMHGAKIFKLATGECRRVDNDDVELVFENEADISTAKESLRLGVSWVPIMREHRLFSRLSQFQSEQVQYRFQ